MACWFDYVVNTVSTPVSGISQDPHNKCYYNCGTNSFVTIFWDYYFFSPNVHIQLNLVSCRGPHFGGQVDYIQHKKT